MKIKLLYSIPVGDQGKDLLPGTIHETIPCPKEHIKKGLKGVWVKGKTEPIRILLHEYELV